MNIVPALITIDVHQSERVSEYILCAVNELNKLDIKATFFIPVAILEANQEIIKTVLDSGHQIGSHGMYHNKEPFDGFPPERYDLLNGFDQSKFIKEATSRAKSLIGKNLTCFRSPCFGISGPTIQLLQQHGYKADFSVNSQRLDFLSSSPFSFNHLLAPRLPYHPNTSNPYRKGNSTIWEIPLSSFIIPFAVMSLATIGLSAMKFYFIMLLKESKINLKPIVYMCHPEDFSPTANTLDISFKELTIKDFLPLKGKGIMARQAFRIHDPKKIYELNSKFLQYIKSFNHLVFLSADQYIERYLQSRTQKQINNIIVN